MNLRQRTFVLELETLVKEWFKKNPAPGHGLDHALRVAVWAKKIARSEKENIFLAVIAGLIHDIGRSVELKYKNTTHHELSYRLAKSWFRHNPLFTRLTRQEKIILLYAIRYHGNDEANAFSLAWILRDADKLDCLGRIGVKRSRETCLWNGLNQSTDLRVRFHIVAYVRSRYAKKMVREKKLLEPFIKALRQMNKKQIKPITL